MTEQARKIKAVEIYVKNKNGLRPNVLMLSGSLAVTLRQGLAGAVAYFDSLMGDDSPDRHNATPPHDK